MSKRGSLSIGVIGAGVMGADHVRTISMSTPGATVTEVFDLDAARATEAARQAGGSRASSSLDLIASDDVDAVIIASPDRTHAELALACITAAKPVLCEKPLGVTPEEARRVVDAEQAAGRRFVQTGFMRRYDPAHRALRREVASGRLGDVRLVHALHRNASSHTSTDDAALVTGSMIHELDTIPWLLDDQLAAIRVESPVHEGFRDPQLATLWTRGGAMATVEVFVNAAYGYDVRCEAVGTRASATLEPAAAISVRGAGMRSGEISDDFVSHFADAYRLELQSWIDSASNGVPEGPSAWDGYVASVAAAAGVRSLRSGSIESVDPGPRPPLYSAPPTREALSL